MKQTVARLLPRLPILGRRCGRQAPSGQPLSREAMALLVRQQVDAILARKGVCRCLLPQMCEEHRRARV